MKRKFFDNSMKNFTSQNLFYFLDIHRINIPGFSTSSKYLIFALRGHFIKKNDLRRSFRDFRRFVKELPEKVTELRESFPELREKVMELRESFPELREKVTELCESFNCLCEKVTELRESFPGLRKFVKDFLKKFKDFRKNVTDFPELFPGSKKRLSGSRKKPSDCGIIMTGSRVSFLHSENYKQVRKINFTGTGSVYFKKYECIRDPNNVPRAPPY